MNLNFTRVNLVVFFSALINKTIAPLAESLAESTRVRRKKSLIVILMPGPQNVLFFDDKRFYDLI